MKLNRTLKQTMFAAAFAFPALAWLCTPVAEAAVLSTICVPTLVEYQGAGSNPQVFVTCGGANYLASLTAGTCGSHTADSLKAYVSLAEAALLSGRSIGITYDNVCGSGNRMFVVNLR